MADEEREIAECEECGGEEYKDKIFSTKWRA
jgi:hypothetical protein